MLSSPRFPSGAFASFALVLANSVLLTAGPPVGSAMPLASEQAAIPEAVTSFGAVRVGNSVYTYGGHTGFAHTYSTAEQSDTLRKLDLATGKWSEVATGPKLQGLALVAVGDTLYRLGGFTAKNAEGEDQDLWSQDSVAAFDPKAKSWRELPSLPEPRSSFDAAVLDNTIYVFGGWQMAGEADAVWHKTAWKLDTTRENLKWEALATPPFVKRALSVAAHEGQLYAIGGMPESGSPTKAVSIYDPQSDSWSEGPALVGEDGLTGFGTAAFTSGDRLYVSTIHGTLQRLSANGKEWELVGQLPTARFFHRMLPTGDERLLILGGANMRTGKFDEVEVITPSELPPVEENKDDAREE